MEVVNVSEAEVQWGWLGFRLRSIWRRRSRENRGEGWVGVSAGSSQLNWSKLTRCKLGKSQATWFQAAGIG